MTESKPTAPLAALFQARFPGVPMGRILPHAQTLRSLLGQGDSDFLVRLAIVEELARSARTRWSIHELDAALQWLDRDQRERALSALRRGGWIERAEGTELRLSERGGALLAALSELFGLLPAEAGEMALGVMRLEWAHESSAEPGPLLRHLLHQVHRILDDAERALQSRSEAAIVAVGQRLEQNLDWAARARQTLEAMDLRHAEDLQVARTLGRSLARLHQGVGRLQGALTELGRRRIPLGSSGLSMADVAAYIGRAEPEALLDLARGCVHEPVQPRVSIVDNLLSVAESVLCAELWADDEEATYGWERAEAGPQAALDDEAPPGADAPDPLRRLSADLARWADTAEPLPIVGAVRAPSCAEGAHRLAMLVLAEEGTFPFDPEAAPGRSAGGPAVRLGVEGQGDRAEQSLSGPPSQASRGAVLARWDQSP